MFRHDISVAEQDIDTMGHVNNSVYLRWVQDAVVHYWQSMAPAEAVAKHLWVALKHEITYRKPTFLNDRVVAEVIAEKVHGARSFFTTVVKRGEEVLFYGVMLPKHELLKRLLQEIFTREKSSQSSPG